MLYSSSNAQVTKSIWDVTAPLFVKNKTEAVLNYDLEKGLFEGHTKMMLTGTGRFLSRFTPMGKTDSVEVMINSDEKKYHEIFKGWNMEYAVEKDSNILDVTFDKNNCRKNYSLSSSKWTDAGQAFIQLMRYIKSSKQVIGSKIPYGLHSNGDTLLVNVEFFKSDNKIHDCYADIVAQNGKALFPFMKKIRVYLKEKEPDEVYTNILFLTVKGKLRRLN